MGSSVSDIYCSSDSDANGEPGNSADDRLRSASGDGGLTGSDWSEWAVAVSAVGGTCCGMDFGSCCASSAIGMALPLRCRVCGILEGVGGFTVFDRTFDPLGILCFALTSFPFAGARFPNAVGLGVPRLEVWFIRLSSVCVAWGVGSRLEVEERSKADMDARLETEVVGVVAGLLFISEFLRGVVGTLRSEERLLARKNSSEKHLTADLDF